MPKYVVTIGGFTHEGISTNVKALGYELITMSLDKVRPKTWLKRAQKMDELVNSGQLVATIIYLHTSLLLQASNSEYQSAFSQLIDIATKSKSIVFIFQDNLDGIFTMRHWETRLPMTLQQLEDILETMDDEKGYYRSYRIENVIERLKDYENRKSEVNRLIEYIYESGVEVAPFFKRSDVTIRLQEFLGDIEQGVFLRLFVSNERLQADQLKSLLSVLERYLRQVEGQEFSIDTRKSENGVVYIFRSDTSIASLQSLNDAFLRFDSFMTMCGDHPEQALEILKQQGLNDYDSAFMVERYSRDYKRLILDTKHEFERKSLLLKQRLETDVLDQGSQPVISWPKEGVSSIVTAAATGEAISININNLSVVNSQKIHNEVEKIINGPILYNDNDKQLLNLFSRYTDGLETLQCRSDLDQLKDNTIAEPERQNARQRLTSFLLKAAKKAGGVAEKVAIGALSQYLDALLKGGM